MSKKLSDEVKAFPRIWGGGYFEGDQLDPLAHSTYGRIGYISVLHATYLRCIKPYIHKDTVALELGPGRGAWTKALLPAREIYALDALSEEFNHFFEYLGCPKHVKYFQVEDFHCRMLPERHFTYMFSFGCLCHVSFEGIEEYAKNIFPKLKRGSNCFWMIADFDKYNRAVSDPDRLSIWRAVLGEFLYTPLKWKYLFKKDKLLNIEDAERSRKPGRWHHAGINRTCSMLEKYGYKIIDPDVGTCLRDPIIHFVKP